MAKGDLERARASSIKAGANDPGNMFGLYNLACVAARQDDPEDAVEYARRAMAAGYNRHGN